MAAAIVPTVDNTLGRVILDITGLGLTTPFNYTYYVERQDGDGAIRPVRNGEPLPAGSTSAVLNDWEAPPTALVRYRLREINISTGATVLYWQAGPNVSWTLGPYPYNCRILHPTVPALSVKSIISELSELARPVRTQTYYPLGRPDPVLVAQVRQSPTGTLKFLSLTDADREALIHLLTQASVFLIQTDPSHALGGGAMWIAAAELTESRIGWPQASADYRSWQLAWSQVSRPPGNVTSALASWNGLVAAFATWAAVVAEYDTWRELVLGSEANPVFAI